MTDITDLTRTESIMAARLRLLQLAGSCSLVELLQATLDEIETLTGSQVGFYHFVDTDQVTLSLQAWSTNTLENMCQAEGAGLHYSVNEAGVWVDCIHERRPVIHNDYASLPHRKGIPAGHAPVIREMVIPVMRDGLIMAVLGVGNKPTDYDQQDVEVVASLADLAWDIVERKRAEEALHSKMAMLQLLSDIGQAILSSQDLDHMLVTLLEKAQATTGAEACSVALIEPETGDLVFRQAAGKAAQTVIGTRLPQGTGLAGWVAQHRQAALVPNAADDARVRILRDKSGFVTRDLIAVPLIARDKVTGVLELINKRNGTFSPDDCSLLVAVAAQVAIAIENAYLLESTQQALKEAHALYRINQGLVASQEPQDLLQDVVQLLQTNFGYYHVQIYVMEPHTGDFILRAGSGPIGRQLLEEGYRLRAGESIVGYTAETDAPFFSNDVDQLFSFVRNPLLPDTKSELAVPVKIDGHIVGLLDIHQMPPRLLTQRDMQLVSAVADQLSIALHKATLYADLQTSLKTEQAIRLQMVQSEKLSIMGRLLASVSHELNNPLQAIQNALFLLRDEPGISPQGRQDLEVVLSESERMSALISRLRTNYRSTQTEDFRPAQINGIIDEVYALIATHLRHNRITFEFRPASDLPPWPVIADQIRQVLLNLLMNAVEAMTTGGRLFVTTQYLPDSHEALISVTDTGPGIDPTILPSIFDPFVTDKQHGTGLGLTITYDIVAKHHGRIQADNNLQGGATFNIWLPNHTGTDE